MKQENMKKDCNIEVCRHSLAHVMMQALEKLYGAIPGVGPAIADGFYHDFDADYHVKEEDLPAIERLYIQAQIIRRIHLVTGIFHIFIYITKCEHDLFENSTVFGAVRVSNGRNSSRLTRRGDLGIDGLLIFPGNGTAYGFTRMGCTGKLPQQIIPAGLCNGIGIGHAIPVQFRSRCVYYIIKADTSGVFHYNAHIFYVCPVSERKIRCIDHPCDRINHLKVVENVADIKSKDALKKQKGC